MIPTLAGNAGERIRALREQKNISQREMAEQVSRHPQFIHYLENGKRLPSLATLQRISTFLGVEIQYFLDMGDLRHEN